MEWMQHHGCTFRWQYDTIFTVSFSPSGPRTSRRWAVQTAAARARRPPSLGSSCTGPPPSPSSRRSWRTTTATSAPWWATSAKRCAPPLTKRYRQTQLLCTRAVRCRALRQWNSMRRYANKPTAEWLMTTDWVTATKWPVGRKWLGPPMLPSTTEEGDRQGCQWLQCGRGQRRIRLEEGLQLWQRFKDAFNMQEASLAQFPSPTDVPNNQHTSTKPFQTADSRVKTQHSPVQNTG